ncbi:MAG: hypothetical protein A4E45_01528 [Methanosaeta sp. PtaB.Bin039]|nr:MAG: hypothetical protein A4E45_01528 [Methanosaeta sp. PtaB.Bin039]OPY47782.1 MAG: hypothetical protein A4E47_00117 [Methanosaeta sp. PtaU1.Bin028]HQF16933.1 hypothetical protein [Methanotrichaceae archaeon]HQI91500.1 hypothetical protein [Methanotrichaceae archaeon]HQJ28838.1 hypothetical protein [Methanotrichaceae archaeon]
MNSKSARLVLLVLGLMVATVAASGNYGPQSYYPYHQYHPGYPGYSGYQGYYTCDCQCYPSYQNCWPIYCPQQCYNPCNYQGCDPLGSCSWSYPCNPVVYGPYLCC